MRRQTRETLNVITSIYDLTIYDLFTIYLIYNLTIYNVQLIYNLVI